MMRFFHIKILTGFLLVLNAAFGHVSLAGSIAGKVSDKDDGMPLQHATVILQGSNLDTKFTATTDSVGHFEFIGVSTDSYTLHVRLLGYEEETLIGLRVDGGSQLQLEIRMEESIIPLDEIRVTGQGGKSREDIRVSVHSLRPARAKRIAGVGEDVFRALQAYPGVLSPNDFVSQLVVRGSGPDQNLILMDDIEIFNPYRLYGMISMFNPDAISGVNLITAGFPAKYGDRLSAVLEVSNKEGDRTIPIGGSMNASITNANLVLQGSSPFNTTGSFLLSARRTYYDLILGPIAKNAGLVKGDVAFPNFADVQAKLVVEPTEGHKLLFNGLASKDAVSILSGPERESPDSISINDGTRNDLLGVAWHFLPSKKLLSKFVLSWYRNRGDSDFGGSILDPSLNREFYENGDTLGIRFFQAQFTSHYAFSKYSVGEALSWSAKNHLLETGIGINFINSSVRWHFVPDEIFEAILQARNVAYPFDIVQTKTYNKSFFYAQDRMKVTEGFMLQPGLRIDYYSLLTTWALQPRLNISYSFDDLTTLRSAWGRYAQSPGYERLLDQEHFFDLTDPSAKSLQPELATHYVLGLDRWLTHEWQLRVESYYKHFDDLLVQEYRHGTIYETTPIQGSDPRLSSGWETPTATTGDSLTSIPVNSGSGGTYGIEFLLEKINVGPDSRLSGWVGYAFSKAERNPYGIVTPYRFDQRHTINVVLDYKLNSWLDIGTRWRYGTNFPYTPPVGITPRILVLAVNGEDVPLIQTDLDGNVIFDIDRGNEANRYSAQLPSYQRLDVRLTAYADFWDLDWLFYLDVINVYNHENVLAYQFFVNDDLTTGRNTTGMLPILPTLGFSVRF